MFVDLVDARSFASQFEDGAVSLVLMDPPYGGILDAKWDRKWKTPQDYAAWFVDLLKCWRPKLTPTGSVVFFGGTGKPHQRMLLHTILAIEAAADLNLTFRNWLTWKKKRAYGKKSDYLYTREEILWYSAAPGLHDVTFNIPYLGEKRGYAGWDKDHPAKSDFKRVSNVWLDTSGDGSVATDVEARMALVSQVWTDLLDAAEMSFLDMTELMRPSRDGEKPVPVMERLVRTHSNEGDLIVDPFCGTGATGAAALRCKRRFRGADTDLDAVKRTALRLADVTPGS